MVSLNSILPCLSHGPCKSLGHTTIRKYCTSSSHWPLTSVAERHETRRRISSNWRGRTLRTLVSHRDVSSSARPSCRGNASISATSSSAEKHHRNGPLPFTAIPGPKPIPIIGNRLLFTPLGGYPFENFWSSCWKLYHEYGPIVRISKIASNMDMVFVFLPEDTRQVFQNEGALPIRPPLDILECYRKSRPKWFTTVGLVAEHGVEWRRLRSAVQSLLKRNIVSKYRQKQAMVARDFVTLLQHECPYSGSLEESGKCHDVHDLLPLLFRYTLEAVGVVSMGIRLGCLDADGGDNDISAYPIISANEESLAAMGESLLKFPLHKFIPTKTFRRLARSQDVIARLVEEKLSHQKNSWLSDPAEFSECQPFIASLMEQDDLSIQDVFLLLVEVFQGGIDATATTLAFCIHYLSRNEEVQNTLYHEVKDVDLTTHNLQGLVYLRAVLQETFRLRPSAPSNARIIQQDAIFSGYRVPAGTLVSSPPVIACHNREIFPDPDKFQPQRWLSRQRRKRSSHISSVDQTDVDFAQANKTIHPYTIVPFGHGARMCPGRRLAEQEIYLLLIQLVKSFKMKQGVNSGMEEDSGMEEEVGQVMRLNMMPDAPIAVKFIPRSP